MSVPRLSHQALHAAFSRQTLFENKSWRLSPEAWSLTAAQVAELEMIGRAAVEFCGALETLYLRAAAGKNLLRNRPLLAPWVADYLDRGKPLELVGLGRHARMKGRLPGVIRPDLLLTDEGFALTELDSVPGGIGLTAFLNRLYSSSGDTAVLGADDAMITGFYDALAALAPNKHAPVIALVVSDEASTYRPEMEWLAAELQHRGRRVHAVHPRQVFPLGHTVCLDVEGTPEKIDVLYRFFELFDLPNVACWPYVLEAWEQGEVEITPPPRAFQEEKLSLALLRHHALGDFWREALSREARELLQRLVPRSWVVDPAPLPPSAVLAAPLVGGRPVTAWPQLGAASQKERDLILKISGYHETAWGARSVVLGSDVPREEWQRALDQAVALAPRHLHLLQDYRKPVRAGHVVYDAHQQPVEREGRVRLCPYYFVSHGEPRLAGALATICPADKKIIHGMQDAALVPARRAS